MSLQIYILNASNTYNYGSMMLCENLITWLDRASNCRNDYTVETDDAEGTLGRLCAATGRTDLSAAPMGGLFRGGPPTRFEMLRGLFTSKKMLSRIGDKVDAVVVLGGDDFTEDHGWRALLSQLLRLNIALREKPVVFLGQSMGPFFSFRRRVVPSILKKASMIYARDRRSLDMLRALGLKNTDYIPDLALMPLSGEHGDAEPDGRALLFPSELIRSFIPDGDRDALVGFYADVIEVLRSRYSGGVHVLPHVLKPEGANDAKMVTSLAERFDGSEGLTFSTEPMLPAEVRGLIRSSSLVVTARMHPAVSALECGVPPIAFSYSEKYHGVLGEGYGLNDFILDVRKHSYPALLESFDKALDTLEERRAALTAHITDKNTHDRALILEKLGEMFTCLRTR